MQVMDLAQHIVTLEPGKDNARLCFYNFLKNVCDHSQPITSSLINSFYSRALTFTHWQENKTHLFQEAQSCLLSFGRANPEIADAIYTELQASWQIDEIETVRISNPKNLGALVSRTIEKTLAPQEQCRILFDKAQNAVAITLNSSRQAQAQLRIFTFAPVAKLIKGELTPMSSETVLSYDSNLQLAAGLTQQVDVGSHTFARFQVREDGCHGELLRGYTFQKYAVMEGGNLTRYPIVFYPIKRMEQFFIDRKSDAMYMELTQILEKATEALGAQAGDLSRPDAVKFAKKALERGQLALEQIFPDDKLVQLLITNLEKTLALIPANEQRSEQRASVAYPAGAWAAGTPPIHEKPLVEIDTGNGTGETKWQTKTTRPLDL